MKKTFKILALLSCLMAMFTLISCSNSSSGSSDNGPTITVDNLPGTTWKQTYDGGYSQFTFKTGNKLDYTAYSGGNGGTVLDITYTKVDSKKVSFPMVTSSGNKTCVFTIVSDTKATFSVDGSNGGSYIKQ